MKNYADIRTCKKCKKEFHPRSNNAFYCDNCCTHICEFCDKEFYRKLRYNYKPRFCSPECANKWQKSLEGRLYHHNQKLKERGNGKTFACDTCGKEFYRQGARIDFKHHYCSMKCRDIKQSVICPTCKKTFKLPPSIIKISTFNYCSTKCRDLGNLARRSNGDIFIPDTKPERIGRKILKQLGVDFLEQQVVGFYLVDVLIQPNIIIQWDGDFWHGNPKKYKHSELFPVQKKNISRDKRHDTYMKNHGYAVLRFWESDLHSRPSWVSSEIAKDLTSSVKT